MNKKCFLVITVLLLVIAGGFYKFIVQGSVTTGTDGRIAIHLDPAERDLVLKEMRAFLISVQQITLGILNDDMELVAEYAKRSGKAAQGEVPGTLMGKLPLTFKKLGSDTHSKFDLLALDAESLGDGHHALKQLTILMDNCVSCHESHRLVGGEI